METKKALLSALLKARRSMEIAKKSGRNTHQKYEYAKYEDIVAASAPALAENGLIVVETLHVMGDAPAGSSIKLETQLHHPESGESMSSCCIVPLGNNDQEFGKALTYRKKYQYSLLVGVACPSDDSDDDDQRREENHSQGILFISNEQISHLESILKEFPRLRDGVMKWRNITSFSQIKQYEFREVLEAVQKKVALEISVTK